MKRSAVTTIILVFAIWMCQMIFIVPVFAGTLTFIGEFLGLSTPALMLTGPLLCPAGTTARVDTVPSDNVSNINPNSFRSPAHYANEFNCVDADGNIIVNRSGEQEQMWNNLVNVSTWIFLTGSAFLVALVLGWIVSRLIPKNPSPGQRTTRSH